MNKKLRIIFVWTLVSLLLQFSAYSLLNNQVAKVMQPVVVPNEPITLQIKATIPGSDLKNIQVSYAKDYLAYTENGIFKVFNLTNQKIVFEKKLPSANDKTMGVLTYQWLPDRNTLLYFYAKKNPNPVYYVTVYPPKTPVQTPVETPVQTPVQTPQTPVEPKTEDPNQKVEKEVPKTVTKVVPTEVPVQPHQEKRYGNPQITELYSLELPNSDEDTAPDDRFNQTIDKFPAGGKIEELVVSTTTNLIYLTVKNGTAETLLEIDVMKNVNTLSKSGETIDTMAASDRYGTLYIDSKVVGTTHQVLALKGSQRQTISNNLNDRILGIRDGKVYIGQVENNALVKIKTTPDLAELKKNPSLKVEWEGSIPFKDVRTLIGTKGQVVIYDQKTAYIVMTGQLKEVKLLGEENYISDDGAELIQLTKEGTSTLVELQPLKL